MLDNLLFMLWEKIYVFLTAGLIGDMHWATADGFSNGKP